jgi:hypothetical protein
VAALVVAGVQTPQRALALLGKVMPVLLTGTKAVVVAGLGVLVQ